MRTKKRSSKSNNRIVLLSDQRIINKIYLIRGKKVMLDKDLAELYQVQTRDLNKAVKRNVKRFPDDFMFQLTRQEAENLMFQIGTSSWGGTRKLPSVFTEQGVAMLSSVLNSSTAINVNIRIIRIFTRIREALFTNKDILLKLEHLEKKILKQDEQTKKHEGEIQLIFTTLKKLLGPPIEPRKKFGYKNSSYYEK